MNYLVYHPTRCQTNIGNLRVYHDNFTGNQDPYIWNKRFLHTFCHITQLKVTENDIIFWVYSDTLRNLTKLYCDCVFVIEEKHYWEGDANKIDIDDPLVDNLQTYEHHYKWAKVEHYFKRRKRYTLKANSEKSYQPQNDLKELIDIIPFLNEEEISIETLTKEICMTKNGKYSINTRPFKLSNNTALKLYDFLWEMSKIKLTGEVLENIHPQKIIKL